MVKGQPRIYIWTGPDGLDRMDLGKDCVGLTVQKGFGGGSFSIELLPRTSDQVQTPADIRKMAKVYRSVRPNAPVSIGMEQDGGIMFGLVDRIERTRSFGGQAMYGLRISGSDMSKTLQDNVIKATTAVQEWPDFWTKIAAALGDEHPLIYDLSGTWGPTRDEDDAPTFVGVTVQTAAEWFVKHAPSMVIPILQEAMGGNGKLADYITITSNGSIGQVVGAEPNKVTTWGDSRIWSDGLHEYEGSIQSFLLGQVLDADFYECWVDTIPNGRPVPNFVLMIRPKPFDEPELNFWQTTDETGLLWNDLRTMVEQKPYHEIPLDDVLQENLGISDADAFSLYKVVGRHSLCGNEQMDAMGLSYPLVCTWNAKKHGIKAYNSRITLVGADVTKQENSDAKYTTEVDEDIKNFRGRLFNWYRLNSRFETGTLQVLGRDIYRIGDKVFLKWAIPPIGEVPGLNYYLVGCSWSWRYGGDYICSLQLTRGHNSDMVAAIIEEIEDDAPDNVTVFDHKEGMFIYGISNFLHYAAT